MTTMEATEDQALDHNDLDANAAAVAQLAGQTVNKPAIDHLPDAVVRDSMGLYVLLAKPGEKIVIERYATVLTHRPWLDTKTYVVVSADAGSGVLQLWDEDLHRYSGTNYISAIKSGYRIKLATKASSDIGKKKRGRPRKNPPVEAKPVEMGPDGKPVKKKRGRPAGSKNRAKDVIQAEKAAKAKVRAAKRAAKAPKSRVAPVPPVVPVTPKPEHPQRPKKATKAVEKPVKKVKAKPAPKPEKKVAKKTEKKPAKKPAAKKAAKAPVKKKVVAKKKGKAKR
jgi:hypothetical protein